MLDKAAILEQLRGVLDPEIGISIVDLNMVRDIGINENGIVQVKIALTVQHCPMAKTLQADVEKAVGKLDGVKSVNVETTAMSKKELEELRVKLQARATNSQTQSGQNTSTAGPGINKLGKRGIRNIIAIVSGKGGVGKSFVTSMLATELRRQGYEVGVLDADLTGPSIAKVFGLSGKPYKAQNGLIVPAKSKTGIKVMSINLVLDDPTMPVIWRGPIVNSVIRQLYWDVDWGDIHYLLVDLPPGCVASGTQVFANPHPVPIELLKPGDYVYSVEASIGPSGRYANSLSATVSRRRVSEVVPQGEAEVFELKTKNRTIRATFNHPILALDKARPSGKRAYRYSLQWKRLTELRPRDIIAVAKKIPRYEKGPYKLPDIDYQGLKHLDLPAISSDDFCRIIGYFMGDGYVRFDPRMNIHQVMFAEPRNGKHREKYVHLLEKVFLGAKVYQGDSEFGVVSRRLALFFRELGLNKSALVKRVPEWVFHLPESQILAFIEGYCDADGHRRKMKLLIRRPGWMCFESPNCELVEGMRILALSVGLRVSNLNSRTRTLITPSRHTYTKTFWGFEANSESRSNRIGAGLIRGVGRQAVGKALVNDYLGFERVSKITHAGKSQVYDLTVEDNHNFISDGIIVHNTSDAPLTIFQSLPVDGVIVVSSPQDLAAMIVAKAVNMAKKMEAPIMGLVENMSYFQCPGCGEKIEIFGQSNGSKLATQLDIPYLGGVPLDPEIARLSDEGRIEEYSSPVFENITAELRQKAVKQVEQLTQGLPIAWSVKPEHE